jgi:hypothetical protein
MDALAVSYAAELNRWGIETSIIVPGAFTSGTNHFSNAGSPADKARQVEYDNGPYAHLGDDIMKGFAATAPAAADVADVAKAIVNVVDMPFGKRPFRVHIDPAQDGAEIVNGVADRVRTEMYRDIGLSDLLTPVAFSVERSSLETLSTESSSAAEYGALALPSVRQSGNNTESIIPS